MSGMRATAALRIGRDDATDRAVAAISVASRPTPLPFFLFFGGG
jgi:hypothetical protein